MADLAAQGEFNAVGQVEEPAVLPPKRFQNGGHHAPAERREGRLVTFARQVPAQEAEIGLAADTGRDEAGCWMDSAEDDDGAGPAVKCWESH